MASINVKDSIIAFAAGVCAAAAGVAAYQALTADSPQSTTGDRPKQRLQDSSELKQEQLSRNRQFFGDEGQDVIERSYVVVVGVGGVGSHACTMLARAGVGRLRLIDFDNVSLSSLNRHAVATREDVGRPKVAALAEAFARIVPSCVVEAIPRLFQGEHASELLLGPWQGGPATRPGYVLDCIDDKATKCALLEFCQREGLRVLSSLGAGGKADPTRVHVTDLALVRHDPLGVAIRQELRRKGAITRMPNTPKTSTEAGSEVEPATPGSSQGAAGSADAGPTTAAGKGKGKGKGGAGAKTPAAPESDDSDPSAVPLSGITCVYSSEPARAKLLPLDLDESKGESPQDFGALPGFRVRVLPVLGTMPAVFGQAMAAVVLSELGGQPVDSKADPSLSPAVAKRLQVRAGDWEAAHYGRGEAWGPHGGLGLDEVDYCAVTMWHLRSPVSGARHGMRGVNLVPCRWRPWAGASPANIVLLTDEEAEALTAAVSSPELLGLAEEAALGPEVGRPTARARLESSFQRVVLDTLKEMGLADPTATIEKIEARLGKARREGWA